MGENTYFLKRSKFQHNTTFSLERIRKSYIIQSNWQNYSKFKTFRVSLFHTQMIWLVIILTSSIEELNTLIKSANSHRIGVIDSRQKKWFTFRPFSRIVRRLSQKISIVKYVMQEFHKIFGFKIIISSNVNGGGSVIQVM